MYHLGQSVDMCVVITVSLNTHPSRLQQTSTVSHWDVSADARVALPLLDLWCSHGGGDIPASVITENPGKFSTSEKPKGIDSWHEWLIRGASTSHIEHLIKSAFIGSRSYISWVYINRMLARALVQLEFCLALYTILILLLTFAYVRPFCRFDTK